jgi:hypothetical protein
VCSGFEVASNRVHAHQLHRFLFIGFNLLLLLIYLGCLVGERGSEIFREETKSCDVYIGEFKIIGFLCSYGQGLGFISGVHLTYLIALGSLLHMIFFFILCIKYLYLIYMLHLVA